MKKLIPILLLFPVCTLAQVVNPPAGGGGSNPPSIAGTIQGANPTATGFISSNEIIGTQIAGFISPSAAVDAACSSGQKAVYFPAGNYPLSSTMNLCSGLHIRCASSSLLAASGTVFQLQPGAAIWAIANPNSDAGGSPATNQVLSVVIDNCTFDLSNDSAALGSVRVKGVSFSDFNNNTVYGNNNPNPLWTEDGSNFASNGGDYNNHISHLNLYDNSSSATQSICMYITGDDASGSNENHHFGGSWNRCATSVKIDAGDNNTFFGVDGEDWQQYGIYLGTKGSRGNASGNRFYGWRNESGAYTSINSWAATTAYTTVWPNNSLLDSNGNIEKVVTPGTSGGTVPTWPTTVGTQTTDGSVTWVMQFNGYGVYATLGTRGNVIDVYNSGLYNFANDLSLGRNIYSCTDNIYGPPAQPINFCNVTANLNTTSFLVNADPATAVNGSMFFDGSSAGGIDVTGAIQGNQSLILGTSTTAYTKVRSLATAPQLINIPNTGQASANLLVSGTALTATSLGQATVPGTNYSSNQVVYQNQWYTGQLFFGFYQSGITATGTIGQTCTLTGFNNGLTGANATLALSATNTIAPNTAMVVVTPGTGGTSVTPPTSATASNGSATCSGTATLSGVTLIGQNAGYFTESTVGSGSNPTQNLISECQGSTGVCNYFFETGTTSASPGIFATYNPVSATSGANAKAPTLTQIGNDWDGSISHTANFNYTPSVGTGANPLNTLTLSYSGIGTSELDLNYQIVKINGTAIGGSRSGVATLTSGTVTVSNAAACAVGSSCVYKLTNCGPNASTGIGVPSIGTVIPTTSFVINSLSAANTVLTTDASSICWQIN